VASSPASAVAATTCTKNFAAGDLAGTLAPFAVAVNCAATSYDEAGSTVWIYDVSAVAQTGGAPGDQNYIERVISVKMGR
jgi:hypothetical protein